MARRDLIDLQKEFDDVRYFSLKKVKLAVKQMEHQPKLIADTRKMMFNKDQIKSMRASWLLLHASFHYPDAVKKEIPQILKFLDQKNNHTGAIRNCMRILQETGVPEKYIGKVYDLCINYTKNATLPHAIRAFSINVLGDICKKYPDLAHEVLLVLNELESFPQPPSIGFCVKKTKKLISRL